jgi:hypothetical protein
MSPTTIGQVAEAGAVFIPTAVDSALGRSVFAEEGAKAATKAFRSVPDRHSAAGRRVAESKARLARDATTYHIEDGARTKDFLGWTAQKAAKYGGLVGGGVGLVRSTYETWEYGEFNLGSVADILGTTIYEGASGALAAAVGITAGVAAGGASTPFVSPICGAAVAGVVGTATAGTVKTATDAVKAEIVEFIYGLTQSGD